MHCTRARDYLSRDLDGMLPPDATVGLREHVDACLDCQTFRQDLVLGRRLLAATEPKLPDNFDWKLQLRLNQALQQRAGETAYPWYEEPHVRRGNWLPAFGAATSLGLAAVLAFAVFLGPRERLPLVTDGAPALSSPSIAAVPASPVTVVDAGTLDERPADAAANLAGRSDRRPLFGAPQGGGLYGGGVARGLSVGTDGGASRVFDRGWSGDRFEDARTIRQLRAYNAQLQQTLHRQQLELQRLKAQLDTIGAGGLDTGATR
ncbi:MAG: zf-HC2 domain-containing protein [bacterium]|nr:zf-HC2 domain-containing protein [bacterium]